MRCLIDAINIKQTESLANKDVINEITLISLVALDTYNITFTWLTKHVDLISLFVREAAPEFTIQGEI